MVIMLKIFRASLLNAARCILSQSTKTQKTPRVTPIYGPTGTIAVLGNAVAVHRAMCLCVVVFGAKTKRATSKITIAEFLAENNFQSF